ncbi:predicted transcriptional regulator [Coriobacteriaceae bacterium EMTCatB1]|nr:predicted transcriptional regulator [Coriobacteriaceae bacterium EMTCatB1]
MQITTKSEYALLALIELAESSDGAPVSLRRIAEVRGLPEPFLEQVFAALKRADIVRAVRGRRGGFQLARPAEQVTALDVVEAVEGPVRPTTCDAPVCPASGECPAVPVWDRVTKAMHDALASFTLAELVAHDHTHRKG